MRQPTWGCHPFPGCPTSSNLGDPLGQRQGVPQFGGCNLPPTGHSSPQCATTGQWILSGQAMRQSPSLTMPPGNISACHTPLAPASTAAHGSPSMPFTPGAPMQSTTPPIQIPPILHLPMGSHHSGCCPSQPALPMVWVWLEYCNRDFLCGFGEMWISFLCGFPSYVGLATCGCPSYVEILPMWISYLYRFGKIWISFRCGNPSYVDFLFGFGKMWIFCQCGHFTMWISFLCGYFSYVDLAKCGYPSYKDILPMWTSFLCGYPSYVGLATCGCPSYVHILPMWISFLCGFPTWIWQNADIPPMWRLYYVDILPMWIWQNVDILLVDILPMWISFLCGFPIWIWQNGDTLPMKIIQQESQLQKLFSFPTASRSSPRRF